MQAGRRLRTLADLEEPQGQFYDASANRLFVATGDGGVTFQLLQSVKFSDHADNIRYDARNRRVAVDAHPESFQLEKNGTRVFVNVPDRKEVQVADVVKGTTLARWPTTAATTCFPMALDEAHQRLFVGCRTPARLLVLDTASGKMIASPEIAGDTDDLFYDPARDRVYVIGGQGFIDVLQPAQAGLVRCCSMRARTVPRSHLVECRHIRRRRRWYTGLRDPGVRGELIRE